MSTSTPHWLTPLHDWPHAAIDLLDANVAVVRVVVARVRGSAPREIGVSMLVSEQHLLGTIGGGQLEHTAIDVAREMLITHAGPALELKRYTLATELAQCCGGVVEILFERYVRADQPFLRTLERAARTGASSLEVSSTNGTADRRVVPQRLATAVESINGVVRWCEPLRDTRPDVWIFGAGHVGQALARVLNDVPVRTTWVDSRAELMPGTLANITLQVLEDPVQCVADAPGQTHFIVMTHSHALDYLLCRTILQRRDAASLGLIGSISKAARFRSRLQHDGLAPHAIAQLTCPIGIAGIRSKDPAVIAIAIAAQLLQRIDTRQQLPTRESMKSMHTCAAADRPGGCAACDPKRAAS